MTSQEHLRYLARRRVLRLSVLCAGVVAAGFIVWSISRGERSRWANLASVEAVKDAVKRNPNDTELASQLAFRLARDGDADEALPIMRSLVKKEPNSALRWFGLGRCESAAGHDLEAAKAYEKAIEFDPHLATARLGLGYVYSQAGLVTDALEQFEKAARDNEKYRKGGEAWARCLIAKGRLQEAWDMLFQVVHQTPVQDNAYPLMTDIGLRLGRIGETEDVLRWRLRVVQVYPFGAVRSSLARLLVAKSHDPEVLREAEETAKLGSTDPAPKPEYFEALALVRRAQGKKKEAQDALEAGLKLDKNHAGCIRLLAQISDDLGDHDRAQKLRMRLNNNQVSNQDGHAADTKGQTIPADTGSSLARAAEMAKLGDPAGAAELCHAVLEKSPRDPQALNLLGKFRLEAIQKSITSTPSTAIGSSQLPFKSPNE